MDSKQRGGEHRLTWLDWYTLCEGNVWTNEVLPLLFACFSMAGLACGLVRLLMLR